MPGTEEVRVPWEIETRAFLEPVKPEPGTEEVRVPLEIETRAFLEPEEENKSQSNQSQGQRRSESLGG